MPQRFFIRHSWKDIDFARKLCNDLIADGLDGFFDERSVRPGESIPSRIEQGLENCDVYLPVFSPDALKSPWCDWEINIAIMMNRESGRPHIIPVIAKKCTVPARLRHRLYINFVGRYDVALDELLIKGFGLSTKPSTSSTTRMSPSPSSPAHELPRMNWFLPIGVLVLVVVVIMSVIGGALSGIFAQPTPTHVAVANESYTPSAIPTSTSTDALPMSESTPTRISSTNAPTTKLILTPTSVGPVKRLDPIPENANGVVIVNTATNSQLGVISLQSLDHNVTSAAAWAPGGKSILISSGAMTKDPRLPDYFGVCTGLGVSTLTKVDDNGGNVIEIGRMDSSPNNQDNGWNCYAAAHSYYNAIWSPDGSKIALNHEDPAQNKCPYMINPDGTGLQKMNLCDSSDNVRYWSTDGKWVIAWSYGNFKFFAYAVDGTRRVPLEQLGKMQVYDERYWPWRITNSPVCKSASFWDCE